MKFFKTKKHLFINDPTSLDSNERNKCKKCGKGKTNHRHLNASIPLMIAWCFKQ